MKHHFHIVPFPVKRTKKSKDFKRRFDLKHQRQKSSNSLSSIILKSIGSQDDQIRFRFRLRVSTSFPKCVRTEKGIERRIPCREDRFRRISERCSSGKDRFVVGNNFNIV